jgi:Sec-independent protein translocase protein TatA
MDILGIGPLELLFIAVIAVIVLGPKGMVKGAREAGKAIRKVVRSPIWRDVVDTSREIREFPRKIAREAGIEQDLEDLRRSTRETVTEINRTHIPPIIPRETVQADDQKEKDEGEGE